MNVMSDTNIFFFISDYGYYRKPDSTECKRDARKPPDLCLHGDIEKLKDQMGSVYFCSITDYAVILNKNDCVN